jgi:heme/copper-type cytochrome/quinol oxidase subunit 2
MRIGQSRSMPVHATRLAAIALLVVAGTALMAQARRDFTVSARRYSYTVNDRDQAEIRVSQDDIVRVTFSAEDIPHSFTIDEYRISRRAEPGKPVTFEFHANQAGEFLIYCNLAIDERCRRELHGRLVVEAR